MDLNGSFTRRPAILGRRCTQGGAQKENVTLTHPHSRSELNGEAHREDRLEKVWAGDQAWVSIRSISAMGFKEILEEIPKLTQEEKRQLWSVLEQALAQDAEEESPELLAAIDDGIRSLESGERTYTTEEARQLVAETVAKARRR